MHDCSVSALSRGLYRDEVTVIPLEDGAHILIMWNPINVKAALVKYQPLKSILVVFFVSLFVRVHVLDVYPYFFFYSGKRIGKSKIHWNYWLSS